MNFLKSETVLLEGFNRLGTPIYLVHRPAGTYPAGSGTITTEERWSVVIFLDNARHSKTFTSWEKAGVEFYSRNVALAA